jgi:copper homeostasis protein
MSIVTPAQAHAAAQDAHLDVVVLTPRDAERAAQGGADRLLLAAEPERGYYSPDPAAVSAVVRETDLPVWVVLKRHDEDVARTVELGNRFVELGAAGLVYGFLDDDLEVAREDCGEMCAETEGVPWLFHGLDATLDADRAWRDVVGLPGMQGVVTAGSTRGLAHGAEELIHRSRQDPEVAELVIAGGGLTPDLVPWLVRAGVRRFAIGSSARTGRSWTRSTVEADAVRAWRMLLDDALSRALGIPLD